KNTGIQIRNIFKPVTVLGCTGAHRPTEKCVTGMNSPFPGGFYHLNQWSSSFCQTLPFLSEDAITKCLKGKTLYLLGDSTVRQWIEYLGRKLKGLKLIKNGAESRVAFDAHSNITVRWNQAQRKVFEDMKVAIVDAWDMTVAANSFAVHPNAVIVSNELAVALSFFCH
ncbi:hypothetical protein COCON_G00136140, partial [Conger conger]